MTNPPKSFAVEADPGLTLGDFDAIVSALYECVLDPAGWPRVLERIRDAVDGAAVWIAVHYPHQVRSVYELEVGTDPEQQRRLRENYVPFSPFMGVVHHVEPGDIVSVGDVIDYREFTEGRFHKEWSAPQGWSDFIMAVLTKEASRFTWLGVCLRERATTEQKRKVAAFRPHVERALRISELLESRTAQAADLAAAMEGLATGVILVSEDLTVRGINPAAERLMQGRGFSCHEGILRVPKSESGAELLAAVAACSHDKLDRAGASVLFSDDEGGLSLLAHILPLVRPRANTAREAVAAIFLTNPAAPVQTPVEAFVRRFALTPSETRVLLAIMDGKNPRAIAAAQGVAMPTIRTHLHRLYDKTGTKGQADIVRLMSSVTRSL
jgi:DNA-binding CsgD family transcriptional regulator/PAS domain-containing protein